MSSRDGLPITDSVDFTVELTKSDLKAADGMADEASHLVARAQKLAHVG